MMVVPQDHKGQSVSETDIARPSTLAVIATIPLPFDVKVVRVLLGSDQLLTGNP